MLSMRGMLELEKAFARLLESWWEDEMLMWVNMLVPIGMKIIIEKNEMIKVTAAASVVEQSIAIFHFIFFVFNPNPCGYIN